MAEQKIEIRSDPKSVDPVLGHGGIETTGADFFLSFFDMRNLTGELLILHLL